MDKPELSELNDANVCERSFKIHYPEFHEYIVNKYPELKWTEKLYWYYHNLSSHPVCPECGKETKFLSIGRGYQEFCGYKCMNSCKGIQERKKETSLKRYGVENAMKSKEVRDKLAESNLKKYGVKNPFELESVKQKIAETNIKKYGYKRPLQNPEVAVSMKETQHNKTLSLHDDIISIDSNNIYTVKCPHPECTKCDQKVFYTNCEVYRSRNFLKAEPCTILSPIGNHIKSTNIELFIRDILDSYNIEYSCNARNIISPKEIDIYIPSKKLAIECNGTYWHSTKFHNNSSHQNKYKSCLKEGVQLLTFWEDWILNKPDIVQSIVLSKLGIYKERIYARQCSVAEITSQSSREFMNKNHIQGDCRGGIRLGLFYKNQLYGVMIFNKKKSGISGNAGWELARFCTNLNTQVIGGAAKLLNYFVKKYHPESIYSFSSNDISTGHLYETLGFTKGPINQSYWYIENGTYKRYHRSSFTKDSIVKRGWKPNKDGWKETDVMYEHGYYQIYDSGQTKWVLVIH